MKINKQHSGDVVARGTYLNTTSWELVGIEENGERLPGPWGSSYVRVPVLAVLLAGPVVGLVFILLLPALAPIALGAALISRIQPHSRIARWIAMPVAGSAQPGLAFLQPEPLATRSAETNVPEQAKKPSEREHIEMDVLIAELEREIDQRRQEGKTQT